MLHLGIALSLLSVAHGTAARCRAQPGQSSWPKAQDWLSLNETVDGRLIAVVPSAKACAVLGCTDAQWSSAVFRDTLPGQLNSYNWEQNYTTTPPELCLFNHTESCAQGNVPLYAINATLPEHLQAGITFASQHDLRVAIKSSGHDYLGRSTARNSLLLWTQYFQDVQFTDSFVVGDQDKGSAATIGSGVGLHAIYAAAKAAGKFVVGGSAATVSAGGGYTQGAGHSAFSPLYGLSADNVLQYEVVLANGSLATANELSNPDLFWALRGGGAGSWGVIASITVQTYPAFPAAVHIANIAFNTSSQAAEAMTIHARHVFDHDGARAGQYFYLYNSGGRGGDRLLLELATLIANVTSDDAQAAVAPFIEDVLKVDGVQLLNQTAVAVQVATDIFDLLGVAGDDNGGFNSVLGSRLIPAAQYEQNPEAIGAAYKTLLDQGITSVLGHLVAGGKVAENADISSAIHPKWRTAKTHIILDKSWPDSTSPDDVVALQQSLISESVPVLAAATGESDSASYSNEANGMEPDFKTTFYGPNYERLSLIKAQYDPEDLFIVLAGVGSERWDSAGMCTV